MKNVEFSINLCSSLQNSCLVQLWIIEIIEIINSETPSLVETASFHVRPRVEQLLELPVMDILGSIDHNRENQNLTEEVRGKAQTPQEDSIQDTYPIQSSLNVINSVFCIEAFSVESM